MPSSESYILSYRREGAEIEEEFLSQLAAIGRAAVLMEAGLAAQPLIHSADNAVVLHEADILATLHRTVQPAGRAR